MNKRRGIIFLLALLATSTNLFAADPLYEQFVNLINESVLPWTRLFGVIGLIGTVVGLLRARSEQSDNIKGWMNAVGLFVGILLLPEIINWAISSNNASTINFN